MSSYELNLRDYLRILRKHRYYLIGPAAILAALTYFLTPAPVRSFDAASSVKFSQSSNMAGLMLQVFTYDAGDSIATQTHILTSLPMMARLAQHQGLIPATLDIKEIIASSDYGTTLTELQSRVSAAQIGRTNIIQIAAAASTSAEAIALANDLADVFAAWSFEERNRQVTVAKAFIAKQLAQAEIRLKRAESVLQAFMEENLDRVSLATDELQRLQERRQDVRRLTRTLAVQVQQLESRERERSGHIDWISSRELNDTNLARFNSELIDLQLDKERLLVYQTATSPEVQTIENKIQTLLGSLLREYRAGLAELEDEDRELTEKISIIPANDAELSRLRRDRQVAHEAYTLLKTKHEEAAIREAEKIREVDIVEYATAAVAQRTSGKASKSLLGALVGLVLGFILALLAENMDTSIGTIEDVESYLQVSVMGVIPHIDRDEMERILAAGNPHLSKDARALYSGLVTQFDPKSPVAEAYRSLRTNLEFSRLADPARVFVVTSSTLEEGKSTTTANLALTLAQSGKRTLVVEADLRRPALHKYFGLARDPGLTEVLLGTIGWEDAVSSIADLFLGELDMDTLVRTPGLDNLSFISAGAVPTSPAELLDSSPMEKFLEDVRERYDIVIIDTPPVLPVTDAAILASKVDGVLLVYQLGRAGRGLLKRAKSHLDAVHANIRGVILNDMTAEVGEFAPAEHYFQYYGANDAEPAPRPFLLRAMDNLRGHSAKTNGADSSSVPEEYREVVSAGEGSGSSKRTS